MKSQTKSFINYVIAEWTNEMRQEVAIGYEFLDHSHDENSMIYFDQDESERQTFST